MPGRDIDYDRPTLIGCGRCDVRWTALTAAHCPTCHETFVGCEGFDAHRESGHCLPPGDAGLQADGGYWRREGERAPGRLLTVPRRIATTPVVRQADRRRAGRLPGGNAPSSEGTSAQGDTPGISPGSPSYPRTA